MGCFIPSISRWVTTPWPGRKLGDDGGGLVTGLQPGHGAVGAMPLSTGCHDPACKIEIRAVGGPRTSRSIEEPGEVARTFLQVNLLHHSVGAGGEAWDGRAGL